MGISRMNVVASFLCFFLVGCSTGWPEPRLADYLGSTPSADRMPTAIAKEGDVRAGFVVINDTSAQGSAPQLSQESLESIKNYLQALLSKEISISLVRLNPPTQSSPSAAETASFLQMAKDQKLHYLVLAVVSSTEIEVPDRFPLGGSFNRGGMRGFLTGYRTENFALAEIALMDVETGQALLKSDGQSWASLERLAVPLESNVYPVVRRNQEFPPIYPTSEDNAHDVMRAVASSDAIDQAVMHLKESWKQARGEDIARGGIPMDHTEIMILSNRVELPHSERKNLIGAIEPLRRKIEREARSTDLSC